MLYGNLRPRLRTNVDTAGGDACAGARRDQLRRALLASSLRRRTGQPDRRAAGAIAVGQVLANHVFNFEVEINYWLPPLAKCLPVQRW